MLQLFYGLLICWINKEKIKQIILTYLMKQKILQYKFKHTLIFFRA